MANSFDFHLPTIPSKNIRFKLQDILKPVFGSRKERFSDNKSLLTEKFINSFNNLHKSKSRQNSSQLDLTRSEIIERKPLKFRSIVPAHKKYLIPLYNEQSQRDFSEKITSEQTKEGYTFSKSSRNLLEEKDEDVSEDEDLGPQNFTENYYFNLEDKKKDKDSIKREIPSPAFKSQSREKIFQRMINNSISPGPGVYETKPAQKVKKNSDKRSRSQDIDVNYKNLRGMILKVLEVPEEEEVEEKIKKELKKDHMFVMDQRDRFGERQFPLVAKLKVPGPGAYEVNESIEKGARKVKILEEQRKLLKQWFDS